MPRRMNVAPNDYASFEELKKAEAEKLLLEIWNDKEARSHMNESLHQELATYVVTERLEREEENENRKWVES